MIFVSLNLGQPVGDRCLLAHHGPVEVRIRQVVERFSFAVHQAEGRDLLADLLEREPAGCVGLEHPAHERRGVRVHDDGAKPGLVPVPARRLAWKLPASQFLSDAASDVLAQVVHSAVRFGA